MRPLFPQHLAAVGGGRRARGARGAASAPTSPSASTCSKEPVELPRTRADVNDSPSIYQEGQDGFGHSLGSSVVYVDSLFCLVASPRVPFKGDRSVAYEDGDLGFLFVCLCVSVSKRERERGYGEEADKKQAR